jgi:glutamine synthetase
VDTLRPIDPAHEELVAQLRQLGVRFVFGGFIDVMGRTKSKCVPVNHLPALLAGHERYTPRGISDLGQMTPDEDECVTMPDIDTLTVLPWDRRFAWMAADLLYGGTEPFAHCTRSILKRQLEAAQNLGFLCNLGVETELYAVKHADENGYLVPISASETLRPTPAYDVEATLDSMAFLEPMVDYMNELDFDVFSFDSEGGDGQYEFDFAYKPALEMADKLTVFRLMAKQVAKETGLFVTFMPKPYTGAWGSGAHFNMSLADYDTGGNLFRDPEDARGRGWSKIAYAFVAGILRHAPALAAICTPTVNSYKRLTARLPDGSISWAPIWATYGDNNRSCMLRLPRNRPCVENRGVDTTANTYLAAAFLFAAGLEGVREGLDPGDPIEEATYDWSGDERAGSRLPRTLLEAVDAFEADPLAWDVFPKRFMTEYVEMKRIEWDEYHSEITPWERRKYLTLF